MRFSFHIVDSIRSATVSGGRGGYGAPTKTFSVALGRDVRHAHRLLYATGLDLKNPEAATPIGVGCEVCERKTCAQRAFPPVGGTLLIDETTSHFSPYETR